MKNCHTITELASIAGQCHIELPEDLEPNASFLDHFILKLYHLITDKRPFAFIHLASPYVSFQLPQPPIPESEIPVATTATPQTSSEEQHNSILLDTLRTQHANPQSPEKVAAVLNPFLTRLNANIQTEEKKLPPNQTTLAQYRAIKGLSHYAMYVGANSHQFHVPTYLASCLPAIMAFCKSDHDRGGLVRVYEAIRITLDQAGREPYQAGYQQAFAELFPHYLVLGIIKRDPTSPIFGFSKQAWDKEHHGPHNGAIKKLEKVLKQAGPEPTPASEPQENASLPQADSTLISKAQQTHQTRKTQLERWQTLKTAQWSTWENLSTGAQAMPAPTSGEEALRCYTICPIPPAVFHDTAELATSHPPFSVLLRPNDCQLPPGWQTNTAREAGFAIQAARVIKLTVGTTERTRLSHATPFTVNQHTALADQLTHAITQEAQLLDWAKKKLTTLPPLVVSLLNSQAEIDQWPRFMMAFVTTSWFSAHHKDDNQLYGAMLTELFKATQTKHVAFATGCPGSQAQPRLSYRNLKTLALTACYQASGTKPPTRIIEAHLQQCLLNQPLSPPRCLQSKRRSPELSALAEKKRWAYLLFSTTLNSNNPLLFGLSTSLFVCYLLLALMPSTARLSIRSHEYERLHKTRCSCFIVLLVVASLQIGLSDSHYKKKTCGALLEGMGNYCYLISMLLLLGAHALLDTIRTCLSPNPYQTPIGSSLPTKIGLNAQTCSPFVYALLQNGAITFSLYFILTSKQEEDNAGKSIANAWIIFGVILMFGNFKLLHQYGAGKPLWKNITLLNLLKGLLGAIQTYYLTPAFFAAPFDNGKYAPYIIPLICMTLQLRGQVLGQLTVAPPPKSSQDQDTSLSTLLILDQQHHQPTRR